MSRMDTEPPSARSRAARKGWARRRLNKYLENIVSYLGHTPDSVTIFNEDFDLLDGNDPRITLKRGGNRRIHD